VRSITGTDDGMIWPPALSGCTWFKANGDVRG
jgi:hypothetical protein